MIKLKSLLLNEQSFSGKTFISVDIQPEYQRGFGFRIEEYCEFLNNLNCNKLIFLFNGPDLGFPDEQEYKYWLMENGLTEEVIDGAIFFDKSYAFFRHAMDNNLDDNVIANFVRFMYDNDIRDSRDMNREMWAKYLRLHRRTDKKELYELLRDSQDCVNIPDLMDFLKRYSNIVLTGGGINECLKEVEIALKALKQPYQIYSEYTY
jgi:hypothetical protein